MKKALKGLSILGSFTGLLSSLALFAILAGYINVVPMPPRLDGLPGRPAAIVVPTAEATAVIQDRNDGGWLHMAGCDRLDRESAIDCGWFEHFLLSSRNVEGHHNLNFGWVAEAAHTPKLANTGADTECNALAALMNTGYIEIYSGTQPANADTAVSTQTLGSTLRFSSTAFGSSSGGVATANTITSDTNAAATITATWFRILKSDNSTVVMDGSICTSGCDINLATTAIVQHATVAISAFTLTQGKG